MGLVLEFLTEDTGNDNLGHGAAQYPETCCIIPDCLQNVQNGAVDEDVASQLNQSVKVVVAAKSSCGTEI